LLLSNASADVGGLGGNGDDFVPAPPPPATANIDDGGAATHASTHNVSSLVRSKKLMIIDDSIGENNRSVLALPFCLPCFLVWLCALFCCY
jgi:hypothetical protein